MLVCFGISWPFNIAKSLRSRTAKGKSVAFELLIIAGYLCGLIGKLILGNLSYVVFSTLPTFSWSQPTSS